MVLKNLSKITKRGGLIFLGDIPDRNRKWNFYRSPLNFYREKISRMLQFKEGECDLGWWVDPQEIVEWCRKNNLTAELLLQNPAMPHAHYRFDLLIKNTK